VRQDAVLVWAGRDGIHLSYGSEAAEQSTRKMIQATFQRIDSLRRRRLLKRIALSKAAFEASHIYEATGNRARACTRLLRSFLLWPLPYPAEEGRRPFARVRALGMILARFLHLRT
jgi:hypothetical protein